MLATALLAAVTALAPAHNSSQGRSRFVLDERGRVAITIDVGYLDVPVLCDADLVVTPDRLPEMRARLTECLTRGIPEQLRLRADGKPCKIAYDRFDERPAPIGGGTLTIEASADCGAFPKKDLTLDWGLFAGTSLDHISVARIEQPHAKPRLAMLSKRASRLVVPIEHPGWPAYAGAALAVVVLGAVAGVVVARRRVNARGRERG